MKIGDIVRLKSGGPEMVIYDTQREYVATMWFDEKQSLHQDHFLPETLEVNNER